MCLSLQDFIANYKANAESFCSLEHGWPQELRIAPSIQLEPAPLLPSATDPELRSSMSPGNFPWPRHASETSLSSQQQLVSPDHSKSSKGNEPAVLSIPRSNSKANDPHADSISTDSSFRRAEPLTDNAWSKTWNNAIVAAASPRHSPHYPSDNPSPADAANSHDYTALESPGSGLGARQAQEQLLLDLLELQKEDLRRKRQQLRDLGELTATDAVDSPRSVREESVT